MCICYKGWKNKYYCLDTKVPVTRHRRGVRGLLGFLSTLSGEGCGQCLYTGEVLALDASGPHFNLLLSFPQISFFKEFQVHRKTELSRSPVLPPLSPTPLTRVLCIGMLSFKVHSKFFRMHPYALYIICAD